MATSQQIGKEFERRVVDKAKELGLTDSHRVPLSGSVKTAPEYDQDVVLKGPGVNLRGQCKKTQKTKTIRIDREEITLLRKKKADFLAFALNQTDIIAMIPFERYLELIKVEAEHETD